MQESITRGEQMLCFVWCLLSPMQHGMTNFFLVLAAKAKIGGAVRGV
jgi:hypothetical protein